ncbi:unnamed protein product [Adineta steineri]|uniref:Uncharacterized protein n=1 Tax=Adineta steineri TaxID=433720 RepID=A0A818FWU1_9BILA|nr:unnamed protein product [Adineta steineri]
MASASDEVPPTKNDEVESPSSSSLEKKSSVVNEEKEKIETSPSTNTNEENKEQTKEEQSSSSDLITEKSQEEPQADNSLSTTSDVQEQKSTKISTEENNKENINSQSREQETTTTTSSKTRSVNFASKVDDIEIPRSRSTSSNQTRSNYSSSRRPVDFIDALVESYKLETSSNTSPLKEEKKYVPKTNRARLNPNWREHRTRRLMNKLEELSLWDREEELKAAQAQSLRDQKWEQIQDRQRNHELCLNLMRQRHESEMESAILLDRGASSINDENTSASIARAMNFASPAEVLAYDLPTPPASLKRRVRQEQDKSTELKTALGRYRQFETTMNNKLDKINQKLQPDHEIMRAYSPYRTSIPSSAVPLFSETYSALLSVPDTQSSNKYNQYHYGVASYLHQPQHAASPDYETRAKSYSNRDVRVPLKEQANDYSYYDDDNIDEYNRLNSIDDGHYTKYRSNSHDYHTKHRSNPIDDDYHTKYRSNQSDDDYHRKYRLNPIDEDYQSKYRSNLSDDDYQSKYRSNPVEDDYYSKYRLSLSSKPDYSPPRRTTSLVSPTASSLYDFSTVANAPRDYSFIHSSQPLSNSIHLRSLNDDLNAITRFSTDTTKKILHNIGDSPNDSSTKSRSSSSMLSSKKNVSFHDHDYDDDEQMNYNNSSRNYSSKSIYEPVEIISLSSTR